MESFVSRKKRKHSPDAGAAIAESPLPTSAFGKSDGDDTDMKIAILASLHDSVDHSILLDALINADGSVEDASEALKVYENGPRQKPSGSPRKVIGYQSSLSRFRLSKGYGRSAKQLTKKGQTLHLYTPEDIAAHTPCSIIHNFLPSEEANNLLRELLEEAPTFERQTFKVFDNVVQSPHSACFYVHSLEEKRQQQTEYLYNGSYLTVRRPPLSRLRMLIHSGCPRDPTCDAFCL